MNDKASWWIDANEKIVLLLERVAYTCLTPCLPMNFLYMFVMVTAESKGSPSPATHRICHPPDALNACGATGPEPEAVQPQPRPSNSE